VEEEFE